MGILPYFEWSLIFPMCTFITLTATYLENDVYFQFVFRQGNYRHLLLERMTRCTQDGWCWYVKIFGRVTKEKIRRWNVDVRGTKVAECAIRLTLGSILVHQTRHNQAVMDLTHPQDLYKPASRICVRKGSICKSYDNCWWRMYVWMFRLALT